MKGIFYQYPLAIFVSAFAVRCAAAHMGDFLRRRGTPIEEAARKDFGTILCRLSFSYVARGLVSPWLLMWDRHGNRTWQSAGRRARLTV
jgi:hypothetical protein